MAHQHTVCHQCHESVPSYDTIGYAADGTRFHMICSKCFNAIKAQEGGFSFTHVRFSPLDIADADGVAHTFHFQMLLGPSGVRLEAAELINGKPLGYRFRVMGDLEESPFNLLARLLARIQRGLAVRYLTDDPQFGTCLANHRLRGHIAYDKGTDGRLPLVIVDGRAITWEEFGEMLMTYEGWPFKLQMLNTPQS